jgi:hypothetical protein
MANCSHVEEDFGNMRQDERGGCRMAFDPVEGFRVRGCGPDYRPEGQGVGPRHRALKKTTVEDHRCAHFAIANCILGV